MKRFNILLLVLTLFFAPLVTFAQPQSELGANIEKFRGYWEKIGDTLQPTDGSVTVEIDNAAISTFSTSSHKFNGDLTVSSTSATAFNVRDADSGDVFKVDTDNEEVEVDGGIVAADGSNFNLQGGNNAGDGIEFFLNGTNSNLFIRNSSNNRTLQFTDDGKLGINTTSPDTALEVNGIVTVSNTVQSPSGEDLQLKPATGSSNDVVLQKADGSAALSINGDGATDIYDGGNLRFNNGNSAVFGTGNNYDLEYDSGETQFELRNSSDNEVFVVDDGNQSWTKFQGNISVPDSNSIWMGSLPDYEWKYNSGSSQLELNHNTDGPVMAVADNGLTSTFFGDISVSSGQKLQINSKADQETFIDLKTSDNDSYTFLEDTTGATADLALKGPPGTYVRYLNNSSRMQYVGAGLSVTNAATIGFGNANQYEMYNDDNNSKFVFNSDSGDIFTVADGTTAMKTQKVGVNFIGSGNSSPQEALSVQGNIKLADAGSLSWGIPDASGEDFNISSSGGGVLTLTEKVGTNNDVVEFQDGGTSKFYGDHTEYGSMSTSSNSNLTTITTQNQYEEISVFNEGVTRGITFSNNNLDINTTGTYTVNFDSSLMGENNSDVFEVAIFVNGSEKTRGTCKTSVPNNGFDQCTNHSLMQLNAGDVVDLRIRNTSSTGDVTVQESNVVITQQ